MWESIQKILESGIIKNVIVQIFILSLSWIKSSYDFNKMNKDLGYWAIKFRNQRTFVDIASKSYVILGVLLCISMIIEECISLLKGRIISVIFANLFYFIFGGIFINLVIRNKKTKVECLTNGKQKKILLIVPYLIFGIVLNILDNKRYEFIIEIFVILVLLIWDYYIFKYSGNTFILDNRYANIYVRNGKGVIFAEVEKIRRKGKWIIVKRHVNGVEDEIRIREDEIIRIDYFGDPLIIVEDYSIFQKRNKMRSTVV